MSIYVDETLPSLIFRRPLPLYLTELVLTLICGTIAAVLLQRTEQIWWALLIAFSGVIALLRSLSYVAGAVEIVDSLVVVRRGFLRTQEMQVPILHEDITVYRSFPSVLFSWGTLCTTSGNRIIRSPTISGARYLHWAVNERRLLLQQLHGSTRRSTYGGDRWLINEPRGDVYLPWASK